MKCLIFSDSHGMTSLMREALAAHPTAEAVLFLGDGLRDFETVAALDRERAPVPRLYAAVRGNCDFTSAFSGAPVEKTRLLSLGGYRILMTHGDLYGAKYGVDGLCRVGLLRDADIVLFGHTHIPTETYLAPEDLRLLRPDEAAERSVPLRLFNPGAVGPGDPPSFGILTIEGENVLFSHGFSRTR